MHIAWDQLALIRVIGLFLSAGLVSLFALGVAGLSRLAHPVSEHRHRPLTAVLVGLCFAPCGSGVLCGNYLLGPRFH